MFEALDTGASALEAQRTRLDTIAENLANINTRHGPDGEQSVFQRRLVIFAEGRSGDSNAPGVHVEEIQKDPSPPIPKLEPGNPEADANGYVYYPNINMVEEQVNSMDASRAYEANVTMMETAKSMFNSTLRLLG